MAIISVITTHQCDLCPAQTTVWCEDFDLERFETNWFSAITFDLCPDCQHTADGLAKIADYREMFPLLKKRAGF